MDSQQRREQSQRDNALRKRPALNDDGDEYYTTADSSADEDISLASEGTPFETVDVKYSYDAPKGPSYGGEILEMALSKAVEKFEDKQTRKLVKDE